MLYAQSEDRTQGRIVGGIATLVYLAVLLLLLLLIKFRQDIAQIQGEGILINFGNVDEAAPGADLAMNDEFADARQLSRPPGESTKEVLTQDIEDAPAVQKPTQKPQRQTQPDNSNTSSQTSATPVETPRQVDRRALFPGRTEGSTATSDGTGQGLGNQGNLAGDPAGSYDGTGTGNSGGSAVLKGRSLVGSLPPPDYGAREQGRVVVEIIVDQQGKVTSASYRSVGSTTQNSTLVAAALRAARQARFNVDDNAPLSQQGTITYNFRLQ